jgi:hypothetical protein
MLWHRREEIQRYLRVPLPGNASNEEIAAAAEVLDLLRYHLRDRTRVSRWMNTPRADLGGCTPIQAIGEGQTEAVRGVVNEVLRQAMSSGSTD